MTTPQSPRAPANILLWATTVLGVVGWAAVTVHDWRTVDPVTLLLGAVMVAAAAVVPVEMARGTINLASAGFLAALLAAGPATALGALAVGSLAAMAVPPGNHRRQLFNTGNFLLSLEVAWLAAAAVGLARTDLVPYTVVVLALFTAVNHGLIGLYYHLVEGRRAWRVAGQAVLWDLAGWLVTVPMAWMFVALRGPLGDAGEALVVIPFGALALSVGLWQRGRVQSRRLERAARTSARIGAGRNPEAVYEALADALQETITFTLCVAYTPDPDASGTLRPRYIRSWAPGGTDAASRPLPATAAPLARVLAERRPVLLADAARDGSALVAALHPIPIGSALVLPLVTQSVTHGLVVVAHREPRRYQLEALRLASLLVGQAAIALERGLVIQEAERLARTDPLIPELYNIRYFREMLDDAVRRAGDAHPVSVAFMDLDRFKAINDLYGHPVGDAVLRETVQAIRSVVRATDVLARYGGDEFVLLLEDAPQAVALEVVGRIVAAVEERELAGLRGALTLSAGVATFPGDAADADQLLQVADGRMYVQKAARRRQAAAESSS